MRRIKRFYYKYIEFLSQDSQNLNIILRLRLVSKKWDHYIRTSTYLKEIFDSRDNLRKLLEYDSSIYDENSYKRIIIRNQFESIADQYKKLEMNVIERFESDLDDDDVFLVSSHIPIPTIIKMFFSEYVNSPSVISKIYEIAFIKSINQEYNKLLSDMLSCGYLEDNLALFIPICYSKHYKNRTQSNQYINVLCYVNIINNNIGCMIPSVNERYVVFELPLEDLKNRSLHLEELKQFLLSKTTNSHELVEIIQNMQSIHHALESVIQNHYYNL